MDQRKIGGMKISMLTLIGSEIFGFRTLVRSIHIFLQFAMKFFKIVFRKIFF